MAPKCCGIRFLKTLFYLSAQKLEKFLYRKAKAVLL